MSQILKNDWNDELKEEFEKPYYKELREFLINEYNNYIVYPKAHDIFNALHYTPLSKVKVLIIGQDPYHDENQAHGLCFSVMPGQEIPPSLKNIFKELHDDINVPIPNHGYLKKWADGGVLLLNTVLTVRSHEANSHKGKGWEIFTDKIVNIINEQDRPIVIFLWGKPAESKRNMLNNPNHLILTSPHPSPLAAYRGFFGSKPFSKANKFLKENDIEEIDWQII